MNNSIPLISGEPLKTVCWLRWLENVCNYNWLYFRTRTHASTQYKPREWYEVAYHHCVCVCPTDTWHSMLFGRRWTDVNINSTPPSFTMVCGITLRRNPRHRRLRRHSACGYRPARGRHCGGRRTIRVRPLLGYTYNPKLPTGNDDWLGTERPRSKEVSETRIV